ncbi:uncharacterized protein LOC127922656 isoform X8 [Oncorhynchus keta]|uniref:uncharacterized protein LOC127922656 isoform X8 n=1 Tax=Oncorhynchus keta TaxID=8018 RepID=UPI00227AE523|nr:uncharacterized protein LOC127922656 isoform X8 [Oncorhynchus keta]
MVTLTVTPLPAGVSGELGYGDPDRDPTPCRCLRGSWDMVTLTVTPLPAAVSRGSWDMVTLTVTPLPAGVSGELGYGDPDRDPTPCRCLGGLGYGDRDPTPCRCLRESWDMVTVTPLPAGVSGELGYGDPDRDPTPCRCLRESWDMVTVTPLPAGVSGELGYGDPDRDPTPCRCLGELGYARNTLVCDRTNISPAPQSF